MQTIKPINAGFKIDIPASPLNAILQIIFKRAAPMTTLKSHFRFLFHAAVRSIKKNRGTAKLIIIFGAVHAPFK